MDARATFKSVKFRATFVLRAMAGNADDPKSPLNGSRPAELYTGGAEPISTNPALERIDFFDAR